MKKTIILLALVICGSAVFAQKGKVTSAQNLKDTGKLDKALEAINEAVDASNEKAEKSLPWPKTWEVRGEIYQAIFASQDENIKALSEDPLTTALESYKKAIELDDKDKFGNSVKIKLTLLTNDLTNQAVEAFNNNDYELALKSFEQILEIQDIPVVKKDNPGAIDTVILFNSGLAAYNAKNYKKAIHYYGESAKYGYNGARTYALISDSYIQMQDTVNALKTVQEGFEKYPEDNNVLTSMIDLYMKMGKNEEALKYLDMAIEQDPSNVTYYFAKGALYEKFGEEENAVAAYTKAAEVDPTFFNAYYNLGALYYNKGVKQIEFANSIPANENEKYEAESKKADIWWEKALPYMEKCRELNPEDEMTLESLKNLYYRMKNMDKYNEILEVLGQ
ncbi:tetratricopeptide repeat protein [Draconibacterium sp. IB214405]|uniref:tetratricopeptide repeat protein n=1 Tax=Draconibacterium sp. IB214405 TaxID=3097352 RepID=UPI002A158314|nr:tetratricopeptide repeat protein [Draconibacterium sp. IB214405]MDX8339650.1 tetratricopeptide repeat protein [Draconibacterium sp. IB214405]